MRNNNIRNSPQADNPCGTLSAEKPAEGWTTARLDRLRELVADGATFTEIGADLGIAKNAALGKASRMRFVRRPDADLTKGQRGQARSHETKSAAAEVRTLRRHEFSDPFPTAGSCRFPHGHPGHPGFGFCGGPARPGRPYCEAHHLVAYLVAKVRETGER